MRTAEKGAKSLQVLVFCDKHIDRYVLFTRSWTLRDQKPLRRRLRRLETDDLTTTWDNEQIVMTPNHVRHRHFSTVHFSFEHGGRRGRREVEPQSWHAG